MTTKKSGASGATIAADQTAAEVHNPVYTTGDVGFGRINLKAENHVVPAGEYKASIAHVRLFMNRDRDTQWLFIILDLYDADGVVKGQVEDKFITIGAIEGSPNEGRVREGLKRLALYGNAAAVDLNDVEASDISGMLVGKRIRAVIGRRGVGVQAENSIVAVKKDA